MEVTSLVSVATGVINPLVSKLSKLLEEESARLKGVRRNTGFIRDELSTMGATLQILADTEELDPEMRIWRDGIRELSYDMEDCIDDFMARADHDDGPTGIKGFFDKLKKLKPRHEIAGEIEKLKARAVEASKRHKRYKIDRAPLGSSIDPRLHALYVEVDKLVGIESPKQDIIKWFDDKASSPQLQVVSIVGPGGLGKTTLANQVYHAIKSQFSCAAFLSVSRKPDMKNVLRNIAERVGVTHYTSTDDEHLLIDRLREHLRDKKYFIVVDDVWDTEAWKTIKDALLNNNCGSRVLTTTRNSAVASCCSSQGDYVYRMKPLSFADSRRLFLKRAFGCEELCHPHLKDVSNKILEKCAGLPLAIITISSLLADQHTVDEWNRVLAAIGSGLAKDPNAGNMTKILYLSYFDLPHHMRTCLLYLSIFPEDCIIMKQRLISRWIAEGFVHEEPGRSTYEVGERYFNDLINRSLIQPTDLKYGEAQACKVHDIVLDFITCKATEENFITSLDGTNHKLNSNYTVRRLSFKHPKKIAIPTRLILSHVRSLTIFGNSVADSLLNFPSLRVLDLGECRELDDNLLANIGKMFLLKYLSLGSKTITTLPRKLEELQYIETLDIKHTNIGEVPSTISRLKRLARLYVNEDTRFADGIIGQMLSLEELSEFGVSSHEAAMSLQQFAQLTLLRRLTIRFRFGHMELRVKQIEDFNNCTGTLLSSRSLHQLYILGRDMRRIESSFSQPDYRPVSLESWCPITPCSLRKLQIQSYISLHVPNWMSSLGNLTELVLNIFCMRPEDVEILGTMPTLFHLEVSTLYGYNGRIVIRGFTCLKYLELEIKRCGTAVEFEAGSVQKVEHLKFKFPVHGMKCIDGPYDFGIRHLPALTKVQIGVSDYGMTWCRAYSSIFRRLDGAHSLSSFSYTVPRCEHFEHFLIWYVDKYGSLPEGIEIHDIEAKRAQMLRLRKRRVRVQRAKAKQNKAGPDEEEQMHPHVGVGEQDETNKGDSGLADTHAPFTFTAMCHELEATLIADVDPREPAVAQPSVPSTFTAVRRPTAMLGVMWATQARGATDRGAKLHCNGRLALQRLKTPYFVIIDIDVFASSMIMKGCATKEGLMDSSVSPSAP
ncbi:hypothetical protein ACQ4PT_048188 [Festuca glaucescens]